MIKRLLFVLALSAVVIGCGTPSTTSREPSPSVLQQASVAFNGNHSPSSIKEQLDKALALYNTPISDENYSRAASTLIALRKMNGTDEMLILDYMIRSYVPNVTIDFPEMAALSSVALKVGDK